MKWAKGEHDVMMIALKPEGKFASDVTHRVPAMSGMLNAAEIWIMEIHGNLSFPHGINVTCSYKKIVVFVYWQNQMQAGHVWPISFTPIRSVFFWVSIICGCLSPERSRCSSNSRASKYLKSWYSSCQLVFHVTASIIFAFAWYSEVPDFFTD